MASGDSLGAVVVGSGFGVMTHGEALRAAGFDVKALVARDPARTKERAAAAGIPLGLTSLSEALALPGVDAVAIATPPHTHGPIALEAIAAGKHVLCEKPFARDRAEAQQMLDAAEKAGVVHMLGTEHRFDTAQELSTRAVRDGVIGEPHLITFLMQLPMFASAAAEVPDWWGHVEHGGGWLGAMGVHTIDHVRNMVGDLAGVSATLSVVSEHDWTAEDSYTLHFRSKSGCGGVIQSSIGAKGQPVFVSRIVGTGGTLWLEGPKVFVDDGSGKRELEPDAAIVNAPLDRVAMDTLTTAYDQLCGMADTRTPYRRLFETFRDTILGRTPESPVAPGTFADGVALQTVLDAARRSSREGTWVEID